MWKKLHEHMQQYETTQEYLTKYHVRINASGCTAVELTETGTVWYQDAVKIIVLYSTLFFLCTQGVFEKEKFRFCVGFQNALSILSVGDGRLPAPPHAVQI